MHKKYHFLTNLVAAIYSIDIDSINSSVDTIDSRAVYSINSDSTSIYFIKIMNLNFI